MPAPRRCGHRSAPKLALKGHPSRGTRRRSGDTQMVEQSQVSADVRSKTSGEHAPAVRRTLTLAGTAQPSCTAGVSTPPGPSRPVQRFDATAVRTHNGAVSNGGRPARDLTVIAVPFYFGAMAAEYAAPAPPCRRVGADGRRLRAARHPGQPDHGDAQPAGPAGRAPAAPARHPRPGPLRQGAGRRGRRGGRRHHGRRRRGAPVAAAPTSPGPAGRGLTERVGTPG